MTDIITAWQATFARRWHSNPFMADLVDNLGEHQGRTALLALCLWPSAHAVHRAAIVHDLGEPYAAGDVSGEVKGRNPDLTAIINRLESDAMAAMGLPESPLEFGEARMLKLADALDAYLFVHHQRPHLLNGNGWPKQKAVMIEMAWSLGVGAQVEGMLK